MSDVFTVRDVRRRLRGTGGAVARPLSEGKYGQLASPFGLIARYAISGQSSGCYEVHLPKVASIHPEYRCASAVLRQARIAVSWCGSTNRRSLEQVEL